MINYMIYMILSSTEIKLYLIVNLIFSYEQSIIVCDIFLNFNHNIYLIICHKFILSQLLFYDEK